jgi:hypothetical protein
MLGFAKDHDARGERERNLRGARPIYRAQDGQQYHGPNDGADGTPEVKTGHAGVAEEPVDESANEGADNSHNDISDDSAGSLTGNQELRDRADDESEDNPR